MKSFVAAITHPQSCFCLPSHTLALWILGCSSEALSRSLDMILPFLEVNQISAADRGNFLPDIGALALAKKIPRALRSPSPTGGVDST